MQSSYHEIILCMTTEYVEEKWPGRYNVISKKLTQKCTDMYNNRKDLRDS